MLAARRRSCLAALVATALSACSAAPAPTLPAATPPPAPPTSKRVSAHDGASVDELVNACVTPSTGRAKRSSIVRALFERNDPRSGPCMAKVLAEFRGGDDEADARLACRAVASLELRE